ncbi:hypothetical protein ACFSCX_06730 [Bacillus salitolerans]|uniref:Uncharacterized protein n=1 Tax=Bacillus salitolerans TaxID=1437434 RepID=A0ABW4LM47_9BACI
MNKRVYVTALLLCIVVVFVISSKSVFLSRVQAFSHTPVNTLPISIDATKSQNGKWDVSNTSNHAAQVYTSNLMITNMRINNGITEVQFSGYVRLNYNAYGAGSQSYTTATFIAKLNGNNLPLEYENNGNSYNTISKSAQWTPDLNTWYPTSNGSLSFYFESRGYCTQYSSNGSQMVVQEQGTINLNQAPSLALSTANNQFLSQQTNKDFLRVYGTVSDQNSGDVLNVKFSIDGLANYQNKILP